MAHSRNEAALRRSDRRRRFGRAIRRHERGIAYANDDLPSTPLAGAARSRVGRYAVRAGGCAVVFTNNDCAYAVALARHRAGVAIEAIVDTCPEESLAGTLPRAAALAGLPPGAAPAIVGAQRGRHVCAVDRARLRGDASIPEARGCAAERATPAVDVPPSLEPIPGRHRA